MGIEEKLEVKDGILKYQGTPCIIIPRLTQGMLIREIYNLAGKSMLRAFRRWGAEGGKAAYKPHLELAGIRNDKKPSELTDADRKEIFEATCKAHEDLGQAKTTIQEKITLQTMLQSNPYDMRTQDNQLLLLMLQQSNRL